MLLFFFFGVLVRIQILTVLFVNLIEFIVSSVTCSEQCSTYGLYNSDFLCVTFIVYQFNPRRCNICLTEKINGKIKNQFKKLN